MTAKELIETYEIRLKTLEEILKEIHSEDTSTTQRIKIKIGCYRGFINDVKEIITK